MSYVRSCCTKRPLKKDLAGLPEMVDKFLSDLDRMMVPPSTAAQADLQACAAEKLSTRFAALEVLCMKKPSEELVVPSGSPSLHPKVLDTYSLVL